MPELNFSGSKSRSVVFDAAVDTLQKEFNLRLQLLHARKADIERLQTLCECLNARGWGTRADAVSKEFSGVTLRLNATLDSPYQQTLLFEYFEAERIECERNASRDVATDAAYELTLAAGVKILLRVTLASPTHRRVTA